MSQRNVPDSLASRAARSRASLSRSASSAFLRGVISTAVPMTRRHRPVGPFAVEHAAALGRDPTQDAVFLADRAILDIVEAPPSGIGRRRVGLCHAGQVVRVQARKEIFHGDGHVGRDPEHSFRSRRPGELAVALLHVPETDLGVVDRQTEPLLVLP